MTTIETTLRGMFVEPTAHHICDSGGIYGRNYQRNAERDFDKEPEATLKVGDTWGPEVTVNTFKHLLGCLELDRFCEEFNALPCEDWDSDQHYGVSSDQQTWLDDRCFEPKDRGQPWNSYNWDNHFDQTLQGSTLERDGETYVLLQIHGGCDVRSGYTDAKLFKIQAWQDDYLLFDDCSFDIERSVAEAAGYPVQPKTYGDSDYITIDWHYPNLTAYDHRISDEVELSDDFFKKLPKQTLEGWQNALNH